MRLRRHHFTKGKNKRLHETLVFLVRLLALSIPLYLINRFVDLAPLQVATAAQASAILNWLGAANVQHGAAVTLLQCANGPYTFLISPDSTAWKSLIFFPALVLAVPAITWKKRLTGLAIGLPVLWIANLVRVLAIAYAAMQYGEAVALVTHDILWRFGLVAVVFLLWVLWLQFASPGDRRRRKHAISRRARSRAS